MTPAAPEVPPAPARPPPAPPAAAPPEPPPVDVAPPEPRLPPVARTPPAPAAPPDPVAPPGPVAPPIPLVPPVAEVPPVPIWPPAAVVPPLPPAAEAPPVSLVVPPVFVAPPLPESPVAPPPHAVRRPASPSVRKHLRASGDIMRSDLQGIGGNGQPPHTRASGRKKLHAIVVPTHEGVPATRGCPRDANGRNAFALALNRGDYSKERNGRTGAWQFDFRAARRTDVRLGY
jgi:hypothetical protein